MVAVDFTPGYETELGNASPLVRYAAFVLDATARRPATPGARVDDDFARLLRTEAARLQATAGRDWEAAAELLEAASTAGRP
jgi:hypothetical protein